MTDPLVTFVVPVAPYHLSIARRALESVEAQTVFSVYEAVIDDKGHGAGYARNIGLSNVTTPFVVFLDADDWVEPVYVEECLKAWQGDRYVYTDWMDDDRRAYSPDCHFAPNTRNINTALIPTVWAMQVGGFDMYLTGYEDVDFYRKMHIAGFCGRRLAKPLFHYGKEGQRSKAVFQNAAGAAILETIRKRYEGAKMACCGQGGAPPVNADQKQEGWVLIEISPLAPQGGQKRRSEVMENFLYEYSGVGDQLWMHPADQQRHPHWYRLLTPKSSAAPSAPREDDFNRFTRMFTGQPQNPATQQELLERWGGGMPITSHDRAVRLFEVLEGGEADEPAAEVSPVTEPESVEPTASPTGRKHVSGKTARKTN